MSASSGKKGKFGLREVASVANVSMATVSRVLNGSGRVDPAIQKSVLAAAANLDIDFSQRNKTKALVFLLSNRAMQHAFHSRILSGVEVACASRNWELIFQSLNYPPQVPSKELALPKVLQRQDVARGVILAGTNSPNLLEALEQKGVPFVVLGNNVMGEPTDLKCDVVFSDDVMGSFEMTRLLIALGHRQICFVGNIGLPWFARCYVGYKRAMEEAGLAPRHSTINSENEVEIGYLGTRSLLAKGDPVSAIFAGNDETAHGVYKGLRDSGLRIPEDVSVVGCDNTVGSWLFPTLTSLQEFPEQLGKQMVELLLNRIANPGLEPQQVTVPTEVIKRDSWRQIHPSEEPAAELYDAAVL